MKIELKKAKERRWIPNNSVSIDIESKIIDSQIGVRDRLQTLVDGNYDNRKYCEEIFGMFNVSFDEDYSDVLEFMSAKKGILKTEIPVLEVLSYVVGGEIGEYSSWTRLSYEVAHHDVDLEHIYSKEELEVLVKTGKVILLRAKKKAHTISIDTSMVDADLPTLENYDFNDIDKNGIDNNQLVIGMVRVNFGYKEARKALSNLNETLLISLNNLKNESLNMSQVLLERASEHERFATICDDKIKRVGIRK